MANKYSPVYFQRDIVSSRPSFGETVSASVGYSLDPLFETVGQTFKHGIQKEAGYNAMKDLGDYAIHAGTLARAVSPDHMASMKRAIDESQARRQVLTDSTIGAQLLAGVFDPVNLVALPLGGPVVGVGKSALRVGVGVAALETGMELGLRQPFDALQTAEESAMNVVTGALFGAGIGAAFSAPITAKARAHNNTQKALKEEFDMLRRIEDLEGLTQQEIQNVAPRAERDFGLVSDEDLNITIETFERQAAETEMEANSYAGRPQEQDFRERVVEFRDYAKAYRHEKAFRELESLGVDVKDPYKILPSFFTDSIFYKAVSTPMKRTLQSKYPSAVKEKFVKSFGDSGIALALNSVGRATPQSIFQRSAVSNGKWVAAHDKMVKLWASDTNAALITPLDINVSDLARRASRSDDTYRGWLTRVSEKRIKNVTDLTDNEAKAVGVIDDYFRNAEKQLEEVGLIGTSKGIDRKIQQLEAEIADLNTRLAGAKLKTTKRGKVEAMMLDNRLSLLGERIAEERTTKLALEDVKINAENQDMFFPRFWDNSAIKANRQEFSDILFNWYQNNPYIYEKNAKTAEFEQVMLSVDPENIQKRVDKSIATILGEQDPTNVDNIGFGYGRSKHFRHRKIDIPNKLVTKFMMTDPLAVMKTYAARIEPRYEYAKMFGKDIDGVMLDIESEMIAKGFSTDDINKVRRDYMHMYDRIAGAVIRNPDALSQKAAFVLREAASFSYMGSAGLAALPDFGRIVMEYDLDNVVKGTQALMEKNSINMTVNETRLAGEAIDILRGSAHMRMVEDLSNNVDANDLLSSARNAFYILNGLAPMTGIAKQLSGIIDAHTIIDYSIKRGRGELDEQSITWLSKYGIGEEDSKLIANAPWRQLDNGLYAANTDEWLDNFTFPQTDARIVTINPDGSPVGKQVGDRYIPAFYDGKTIFADIDYIEGAMYQEKAWTKPKVEGVKPLAENAFKTPRAWSNFIMLHEIAHTNFAQKAGESKAQYENRINDIAMEQHKAQSSINEETVLKFRSALNSGVLNTIMSGTPADKPIITDGVAYVPMSVASKFGMVEDPKVRGYARIENGLMGLPFQFYSYTLANINKTVATLAQGQIKNRAIGISTSMGLAYLSLKLRTPDFVWEDMSAQDKFARSFDMSGVMALYSDLFYTSMHTSLALGGPNITGGILAPKFPQDPSAMDAVTGLAGAGPSWAADVGGGMYQFANGEYGEGAKTIARNAPFARLWFLKDDINQITRAWAQ